MGFFVHCGNEDNAVLLREVGKQDVISGLVPAGYVGRASEIWFARVLPPSNGLCGHHIVFTTPYVVLNWAEVAFIDYLKRETARLRGAEETTSDKRPARLSDAIRSRAESLE